MTKDEAVAYINAQTVCALAAIEGMKVTNAEREANGYAHAYDEEAFAQVPVTYGIHHNAVIQLFMDSQ